jgi:hypothetical protein
LLIDAIPGFEFPRKKLDYTLGTAGYVPPQPSTPSPTHVVEGETMWVHETNSVSHTRQSASD